ncbi:hypothetical protein [Proteus sp. G2663]|uniref:hypothetical protein n=1 Tax=Proteus sp. G2663 TaxID=2698876 RepID=UPI00192A0A57|nr:hypothetical protein [Proteus sp. G2663]NBM68728.1 hypothetical protein [Proteus sp. G2663]
MINQNLEVLVDKLSAQVVQQGQQIAELQKQLADMQKETSCDLGAIRETHNEIISSSLAQSDYAASRLNQLFIK